MNMYRQAAIIALDECIKEVENFGKGAPIRIGATMSESTAWSNINIVKARAITGINIAKRLLEESDPKEECEVHIIQVDATDMPDPFKTMLCKLCEGDWGKAAKCPRCGNEEICPGDKFCKICGMALMAGKEAE
jgi:hypothetical protein